MIFEREPLTSILSPSVRGEQDRIVSTGNGQSLCLPNERVG
jgi:hypothetical protein